MREEKYILTIVAMIAVVTIVSMILIQKQTGDNRNILVETVDNIGYAAHPLYPSFEQPITKFSIDRNAVIYSSSDTQQSLTITTNDTAVYSTAYISINSSAWQQVTLTGTTLGTNWITGKAQTTINIPKTNIAEGTTDENYIIIYSCTKNTSGTWDCHNNKWQLQTFNTTKNIDDANNTHTNNQTNTTNQTIQEIINPYGKVYYISSSTGNDSNNGTSPDNPWKTLTKVNSTTFKAGDMIMFKRGDTFYGSMVIKNSGNNTTPIIYSSYGTGEKPIITGFTQVTGWNNLGGNIWESTNQVSSLSTVNMVTINGINTAVGRYPNTNAPNGGYLTILSNLGNTSLTSNNLTGTPDWTGAEVVIRPDNFHMNRAIITSQSGSTLNFNAIPDQIGGGNGFFIQSDPRTLDLQNEWYYNPNTHKIQVYSTSIPGDVDVSSIEKLVTIQANYLVFDNISFTGANTYAIYAWDHAPRYNHVSITNNDFTYTGISSIFTLINDLNIENNNILESNRNAMYISYGANNLVRNNTIKNIGVSAGMRPSTTDQPNSAVETGTSENLTIEYNTINNTGFNGMNFYGNNILIKNNYIDTVCSVLDDCGGIYTYSGSGRPTMNNITIFGNIVVNGIGTPYGVKARFPAAGIYLDDNSKNVEVANNSVADVYQFGLFIASSGNVNTHDNTVYDASQFQYYSVSFGSRPPPTGDQVKNNIFVSKFKTGTSASSYQKSLAYYFADSTGSTNKSQQTILASTTLNNNYYARPIADDKVVFLSLPVYNDCFKTLSEWQNFSGQDGNSHGSPKAITNESELRFEYNPTRTTKTITLDVPYIDMKNVTYTGSVTLQPYSSIVLIRK